MDTGRKAKNSLETTPYLGFTIENTIVIYK